MKLASGTVAWPCTGTAAGAGAVSGMTNTLLGMAGHMSRGGAAEGARWRSLTVAVMRGTGKA
ncbi:hypothetical protein GCM10028793_19030 [Nocardiopsis oceani]